MSNKTIYQAQMHTWEDGQASCGHRHRKVVQAEECLKRLYPAQKAHVAVSEDGGLNWQRMTRDELREARHLWEEERERRWARRP